MAGSQSIDDVVQVVVPRLQDAVASEIRNLAQELAARADEVRAEAEAEHEASLARERELALAERADAVSAAMAEAREQAALDVALRLVDGVRRLDEQATLSGVLDALADLAAAEAGRAAVFVVADEGLQVWRVVGLDAPAGETKRYLTATEAGIVGRAIGECRSVPVVPDAGKDVNDGDDRAPAFALLPKDRAGVAVPVLIGGEPLVAVYADEGSKETGSDSACWVPVIEILASHAGARLEAVAAERAAAFARDAVGPAPVGDASAGTDASGVGG